MAGPIGGGYEPDGMAPPVTVEVIFDPACPWCYIGKRRLEKAVAQASAHAPVRVRWWPFLLNPNLPVDGVDRTAYLLHRFGSERRISRIYGVLAELGHTVNIDFAFEQIRRTPNTVDAHRLVLFADRHGRADEAVEALFQGHFADGRDIGQRQELLAIAAALGLDIGPLERHLKSNQGVAEIYEANARAHRLNINGVPSFLFNGRLIICGAQEADILARMLQLARECADFLGDAAVPRPFSLPLSDLGAYASSVHDRHPTDD